MSNRQKLRSSRRAFFTKGTALAAGLASAGAVAGTLARDDPRPLQERLAELHAQLDRLADRDALRGLFMAYNTLLGQQSFETLVGLFAENATFEAHGRRHTGRDREIRRLFLEEYATERAQQIPTAFRQDSHQLDEQLELSEDSQQAEARFRASVRWTRPLQSGSVLEDMARQQGLAAENRWEDTRFELRFVREGGQWKIAHLAYRQSQASASPQNDLRIRSYG